MSDQERNLYISPHAPKLRLGIDLDGIRHHIRFDGGRYEATDAEAEAIDAGLAKRGSTLGQHIQKVNFAQAEELVREYEAAQRRPQAVKGPFDSTAMHPQSQSRRLMGQDVPVEKTAEVSEQLAHGDKKLLETVEAQKLKLGGK